MELFGFVACALIGVSLGLIGAGGSILTVPVLVYLFHMPPLLATSYALFLVGTTSVLAAAGKFRKGHVMAGPALVFGLISMLIVLGIRHYLLPLMPKLFFSLGPIPVTYDRVSMLLFSGLMILAARPMIGKNEKSGTVAVDQHPHLVKIIPYALMVGVLTGFLGVGGGFLIIPVMTIGLGLDIKKAIGTSLAVIALNSLSGFVSDAGHIAVNWQFLAMITLIALAGSLSGGIIADRVNPRKLKACFGWFVLSLGLAIVTGEGYRIFKLL